MRDLRMRDTNGAVKMVRVDDELPSEHGGFGAVYRVVDDPRIIVKRVDFTPHVPIGNINRYLAHIKMTRDRLLRITAEESERDRPRSQLLRSHILRNINEIVDQALSTHWCFDIDVLNVSTVWFLQKRAPGVALQNLFQEAAPPALVRTQIALDLVDRMRTLRRADLVHLDCVADNIFVDLSGKPARVAVIDLDGCGIASRAYNDGGQRDEWEHLPLTLGHLSHVRPPPWYPQAGVTSGPKAGNYLFAERWVVLDTVIRILTWNTLAALSWVGRDARNAIVDGYSNIGKVIATAKSGGHTYPFDSWVQLYKRILIGLRSQFSPLPVFIGANDQPNCLSKFADLAQKACLYPRELSHDGGNSFYDLYGRWLRSL